MLCGLAILLVGAGVYVNSLHGAFVLDDEHSIVLNGEIRQIGPAWKYSDLHRPLHRLSLAVNFAISGLETWSYHVFNVSVHLLTALVLFGVVRRTLRLGPLAERFGGAATPLALAVALIWVVHPLNTGAVTYVIQRTESLMALFFLLTFYCAIRGYGSSQANWWHILAVACCAASMLTKEVGVVIPPLLLLFDVVYVERRVGAVFRRRWGLYLALALCWGLVVVRMFQPDVAIAAQDIAMRETTRWEYLRTQPAAILHYVRLTFWPSPLVLDHFWRPAEWPWGVAPRAAAVLVLLAATGVALWKAPRWGYLGAWFFVILAPTSSILALPDMIFEHRMYLPLMAIVAGVCAGAFLVGRAALRRLVAEPASRRPIGATVATLAAGLIVAALAYLTVMRNRDYATEATLWRDVVAKVPGNPRAWNNLGKALYFEYKAGLSASAVGGNAPGTGQANDRRKALGKLDEALGHYARAIDEMAKIQPPSPGVGYPDPYYNYALACSDKAQFVGDPAAERSLIEGAVHWYTQALIIRPDMVPALNNLAGLYLRIGRTDDALALFRKAVALAPGDTNAAGNLGMLYMSAGRPDLALPHLTRIIGANPGAVRARQMLGVALVRLGRHREAVQQLQQVLAQEPGSADAIRELAWVRATSPEDDLRNGAEAVKLTEGLIAHPTLAGNLDVINTRAAALAEAGRFEEAADLTRRAMAAAANASRSDMVAVLQDRLRVFEARQAIRDMSGRAAPK